MKVAIYNGVKNVAFEERAMPTCDENGIVVKNICASICGSDVTAYNYGGDSVLIWPGFEFGHEMVSRVVKVGKNVEGIKEGDRVFPLPQYAKNDYTRASTVGGFSEYIEIPQCKLNQSVYLVPDAIEDELASIIEPFGVGANAAIRLHPEPGKKAIVFGAGAIGLTAAITLKYKGCDVVVVDLLENRLKVAESLGMMTCNLTTEDYFEKCTALLGGGYGLYGPTIDCDYYIDCAGKQSALDSFTKYGKGFSKLALVGIPREPFQFNAIPLIYTGMQIIGPAGADGEVIRTVMEILASHQFPVQNMITHTFKQDELVKALETASTPTEAIKVEIKYE